MLIVISPPDSSNQSTLSYIQLLKVSYSLNIINNQLTAQIIQHYRNGSSVVQLAEFIHQIPTGATICDFQLKFADKVLNGIVRQRESAFNIFNQARQQGKTTSHFSSIDSNEEEIFKTQIANIPPRCDIFVTICYLNVIPTEFGQDDPNALRLIVPTSLYPRYGAPVLYSPDTIDAISFNFELKTYGIKSIELRSNHPEIDIDFGTKSAVLSNKPFASIKDDIVFAVLMDEIPLNLFHNTYPKIEIINSSGMIRFCIPKESIPSYSSSSLRILLICDLSGSMEGTKLDGMKQALIILLKSLPQQNTFFNIVCFGSNHSFLFTDDNKNPLMVPYDKSSSQIALDYIKEMKADMGGTEMLSMFRQIIPNLSDKNIQTQLLLFTDGQVHTSQKIQIGQMLTFHQSLFRCFCVGLGNSVSHQLLEHLSETGKGSYFSINDSELETESKLSLRLMQLFNNILSPSFSLISISDPNANFIPLAVSIIIKKNQTFFPNTWYTVFFLAKSSLVGPQINLKFTSPSLRSELNLKINIKQTDNHLFDRIAIRNIVPFLISNHEMVLATKLSEQFSVMVPSLTSFVVVDDIGRVVPSLASNEFLDEEDTTEECAFIPITRSSSSSSFIKTFGVGSVMDDSIEKSMESCDTIIKKEKTKPDVVTELINLQDFQGRWLYADSVKLLHLLSIQSSPIPFDDLDKDIWMTLVIVSYFETKQQIKKPIWEMCVQKSKSWLTSIGFYQTPDLDIIMKAAQSHFVDSLCFE